MLKLERYSIVISFDALHTLIDLQGGCGLQYRIPFREFFKEKLAIDINDALPAATVANMEHVANDAIHHHVSIDRVAWQREHMRHNTKEMSIGGLTQESVRDFWTRVLKTVYTHPSLYKNAEHNIVQQIHNLMQSETDKQNEVNNVDVFATENVNDETRNANELCTDDGSEKDSNLSSPVHQFANWDAFLHYVIDDVFTSISVHPWLSEGKRTLEQLRMWNTKQEQKLFMSNSSRPMSSKALSWKQSQSSQESVEHLDDTKSKVYKVPVLAFAPCVLTNMDSRVRTVFTRLGAFDVLESKHSDADECVKKLPTRIGNISECHDKNVLNSNAPEVINTHKESSISNKLCEKDLEVMLQSRPLLSRVVTSADVEYAKPSAKGLLYCASLANINIKEMHERYIHVGDHEADKMACQAANCRYVQCNHDTGITWEQLHTELKTLEKDINA